MIPKRENKNDEDITIGLLSKNSLPKLLKKSAGGKKCCIFRIPPRLEKNNENAYEPRVVSIGPYHHGKTHLLMIQEHKHRLLGVFLAKVQEKGGEPQDLIEAVSKREQDLQDSYSEILYDDGDVNGRKKMIDMMVLDGCFILMLFLVVGGGVDYDGRNDDPIFRVPWILPAIRSDLLLLENQVPLFLLQTILDKSKIVASTYLNAITFNFFRFSIDRPDEFWSKRYNLEAKHLLDLIRNTFLPTMPEKQEEEEKEKEEVEEKEKPPNQFLGLVLSAKKLQLRGIKLKTRKKKPPNQFLGLVLSAKKLQLRGIKFKTTKNAESFLDIKLKKNVVEIPQMILDDFIISVFLNCVAFEQFYADSTNHVTSYVAFMGCLVKTEEDAIFLDDKGIIENYFGTGIEVSQIFRVIGKDIVFHVSGSYLEEVFVGVNEYTSKGYHVHLAEFHHTHFNTPWTCLSSCAALILVILTVFQASFAIYVYVLPPKQN